MPHRCGIIVNGKMYVWGGKGDRIKRGFEFLRNDPNFCDIRESISYPEPEPIQENDKYCYCTIDKYDLKEGIWQHIRHMFIVWMIFHCLEEDVPWLKLMVTCMPLQD